MEDRDAVVLVAASTLLLRTHERLLEIPDGGDLLLTRSEVTALSLAMTTGMVEACAMALNNPKIHDAARALRRENGWPVHDFEMKGDAK